MRNAAKSDAPRGILRSSTMMVMRIARTPSLNASSRPLDIACLRNSTLAFSVYSAKSAERQLSRPSKELLRRSALFQRTFSQIKKQRQAQRHTDDQCSDNRQPKMANAEPLAFAAEKENQHHGRNQHVHPEEPANPSGEELTDEKSQW